jgi:formate dehydrogenase maturation protein FdhE
MDLNNARNLTYRNLEEACEQYLIRQRAEARQQMAIHILSEQKKLQEFVNSLMMEFTNSMAEKMQKIEVIEQEYIRNALSKQLEEDIDEFMNLQLNLLESFRRICIKQA